MPRIRNMFGAVTGIGVAIAMMPSTLGAQSNPPAAADAPAPEPAITKDEVRRMVTAWNEEWAAARLAGDSARLDRLLPQEYSALFGGESMSRAEFLAGVVRPPAGIVLRRFDPLVLTVSGSGDEWIAVVEEKLEIDRTGQDGAVTRTYHLWVIRDTWKMEDGRLVLALGEVISNEGWRNGTRPPFDDWSE